MGKAHAALASRLQHGSVAMVEPADPAAKAAWRDILETLFSPEDAALAARLPVVPASAERIAGRVGRDKEDLRAHLEAMADRGLVLDLTDRRSGETLYMLAPPVVGLFEFSMMRLADHLPKAKLAEAYDTYLHAPGFLEEAAKGDTVVGRALAHETALFDGVLSEVLDWERASALVEDSRMVALTNCFCRHKAHHMGTACDNPLEICMSLGGAAAYLVRRGLARETSKENAQEVLVAGREAGLVHIADNVQQRVTYICSCCSCCCEELYSVRVGHSLVVPSGFQPKVDAESCNGCARCLRACPVDAIALVGRRALSGTDSRADRRPVAVFDYARCIGCGVCSLSCRQHSILMQRRPQQRRVPSNTVEFMTRAMLERGRLADLLIDGTAGRGPAFANAVLEVIVSLPPIERLMASEQVRSRFVRFALSKA